MSDTNPNNPFAGVLQDGEQILWRGQPDAEACARENITKLYIAAASMIAFGILVTGGVYAVWRLNRQTMPWWLMLILIGLPTIGALICIFRVPAVLRRDAELTCYAITTRRILCLYLDKFASLLLQHLSEITLKMYDEVADIGTVEFGRFSKSPESSVWIIFDNVPDVHRVYDILAKARERAQAMPDASQWRRL